LQLWILSQIQSPWCHFLFATGLQSHILSPWCNSYFLKLGYNHTFYHHDVTLTSCNYGYNHKFNHHDATLTFCNWDTITHFITMMSLLLFATMDTITNSITMMSLLLFATGLQSHILSPWCHSYFLQLGYNHTFYHHDVTLTSCSYGYNHKFNHHDGTLPFCNWDTITHFITMMSLVLIETWIQSKTNLHSWLRHLSCECLCLYLF
jgi:hypothetical protein